MSAPLVSTPADLPDLRLWLVDQWKPGGVYAASSAVTTAMRLEQMEAQDLYPDRVIDARALAKWEEVAARQATLWWVGEEMVDLLTATAPSLPDDVMLADLPKPSASGIVVFAKPWVGLSATDDRTVTVDMIVWGTAALTGRWGTNLEPGSRLCLSISSYERLCFDEGLGELTEAATLHGCMSHGAMIPVSPDEIPDNPVGQYVFNEDGGDKWQAVVGAEPNEGSSTGAVMRSALANPASKVWRLTGSTYLPLGRSDWPFDEHLGTPPWPMPADAEQSMIEDRRIIAALWTLLQSKALVRTVERPADRPARRRSERAGISPTLSTVRTITLRQAERSTSDGSGESNPGRYSHRWIVQPHFVYQPCGPGRSQRKLIVRGPFVKGPSDKPLHTPEIVRAWVR